MLILYGTQYSIKTWNKSKKSRDVLPNYSHQFTKHVIPKTIASSGITLVYRRYRGDMIESHLILCDWPRVGHTVEARIMPFLFK